MSTRLGSFSPRPSPSFKKSSRLPAAGTKRQFVLTNTKCLNLIGQNERSLCFCVTGKQAVIHSWSFGADQLMIRTLGHDFRHLRYVRFTSSKWTRPTSMGNRHTLSFPFFCSRVLFLCVCSSFVGCFSTCQCFGGALWRPHHLLPRQNKKHNTTTAALHTRHCTAATRV